MPVRVGPTVGRRSGDTLRRVADAMRPLEPAEATISITPRQRAHLKSLAHPLRPILHIGKEGVTGTTLTGVGEALNTRELLKIKVLESSPQSAAEIGADLESRIDGVELVQVIGRTIVLYRRHPERPEIQLP